MKERAFHLIRQLKSNISQQEQWRTNNSAVKMVELVNELMKRFDKNIFLKKANFPSAHSD